MSGQVSILPSLRPDGNDSSIEQKFLFDATRRELLLDWLECHLVRDPEFYFSPIVSLYYDTPSLSLYDEVRNGDYLKTKVRLRWYEKEFLPGQESVSCFFEIKRKFGARRQKRRKPLTLDPRCFHGDLFFHPTIREVPDTLPEWRLLVRGVLVPLLVVDYARFRFIEPHSGARISLDTGISCSRVNSAYLAGTAPAPLEVGVLEVKGSLDSLPRCLRPVERHLRKQSFSKYAHCCELLIDPLSLRSTL
jgi:VTC domain-containing protein